MLKKPTGILIMVYMLLVTQCTHPAAGPRRGTMSSLFPIVTAAPKGKRMQLSISVPGEFKAVHLEDKRAIQEFIPVAEQLAGCTQKIVIRKGTLSSGLAGAIVKEVKSGAKVLEETEKCAGGYTVTTLIVTRVSSGRRELVGVQHYAGPSVFAGLKYSIVLDGVSEAEALAKVKSFFARNVSAVTY